jgi:uncharacterized protein (TIGR00369 family)
MAIETVDDESCFVCGKKNSHGLGLSFEYPERGSAESRFKIPDHFTGWRNMTHGGLLSMLLDEAMAHACYGADRRAVTADLRVTFRKPVEVGEPIVVKGRITGGKSRIIETEGSIENSSGETVATAVARFLQSNRS